MRVTVKSIGVTDPLLSYNVLFLSLNLYLYCKQGQNKLSCSYEGPR